MAEHYAGLSYAKNGRSCAGVHYGDDGLVVEDPLDQPLVKIGMIRTSSG